jgi:hypothetical protein
MTPQQEGLWCRIEPIYDPRKAPGQMGPVNIVGQPGCLRRVKFDQLAKLSRTRMGRHVWLIREEG